MGKNAGLKAERKLAKRMGATLTPGSGALDGAKGDMFMDDYLIESKSTISETLSLHLRWLDKIRREALGRNKVPALAIQFTDGTGTPILGGSWVAVPENEFKALVYERDTAAELEYQEFGSPAVKYKGPAREGS